MAKSRGILVVLFLFLVLSYEADISPRVAAVDKQAALDFFPLGLFDVAPEDCGDVKAAGFNMVHQYHSTQSLAEAEAYLIAAEAAGLRVRQNMPDNYLYETDEFWIGWVTTLSAYDALTWWFLPEEPTDHAAIARLYDIVHSYDPQQRPAASYFADFEGLGDWCDVVDIMMVGSYPEYYEEPRANMKTWIDAARQACPSLIVIGVPQFFDGSDFGDPTGHPSPHELRCDAYTALIAGSQGLDWFYYPAHERLPTLWQGLQQTVSELNELVPVVMSPDIAQTITVSVVSGPTHTPVTYGSYVYDSVQILQKGDSGTYLFASNLATDTVVVEFSGYPSDVLAVEVLYEGRVITVSAGSFRDGFAEADVHIYRTIGPRY